MSAGPGGDIPGNRKQQVTSRSHTRRDGGEQKKLKVATLAELAAVRVSCEAIMDAVATERFEAAREREESRSEGQRIEQHAVTGVPWRCSSDAVQLRVCVGRCLRQSGRPNRRPCSWNQGTRCEPQLSAGW